MFFTNSVVLPTKRLQALNDFLSTLEAQMPIKNISEKNLLEAKIAPDMFDFSMQIQLSVANALQMAETFSHKKSQIILAENPTFADLKQYLADAINFLQTIEKNDLKESPESAFATFFWAPGKKMTGENYLFNWALPNFLFHIVTAYNIARALGFEIGKAERAK